VTIHPTQVGNGWWLAPRKIYESRWNPDISKELPPSEAFEIEVNYDGQPHKITGLIHHFNELFDSLSSAGITNSGCNDSEIL
jgi:hypothetical protein